MDKFIGKFSFLPEKTEGFDEFAKAMGLPDAAKEALKTNKNLVLAIEANADGSYRDITDYGGGKVEVFDFRLDEPADSESMGMKMKHVFTLKANRVVGETSIVGTDTVIKTVRYWQGEFLAFDTECKGAVSRSFYRKL